MSDRLLVEALQARDPSALTAVYDAYGDRIYAYCWFQWNNRDAAQEALRDTLIVAEAHVGRLRDPDRFGTWLYAIARHECALSMPYGGRRPDVSIATHQQDDVDQRVMAWRAVMSLAPLSREAMELHIRHRLARPELAAVLGLHEEEVTALLDRARAELGAALTAELLAHDGPYDCRVRAELLRERRGELSADLRARLLEHALACRICGPHRPRNVSPVKVYDLLPTVTPPESLRRQVLSCFGDADLTGYRCAVAAQIADFDEDGFPVQPPRTPVSRRVGAGHPAGGERGVLSRHPVMLGAVAALLVGASMGAASVVQLVCRSDDRHVPVTASRVTPKPPNRSGLLPAPPLAGAEAIGGDDSVAVPPPDILALGAGSSVPQPVPLPAPLPPSSAGRTGHGWPMPPWGPPPIAPMHPPVPPPPTGGPPGPAQPPDTPPPPTQPPPTQPPPTQPPPTQSPPETPPPETPPPTQNPPATPPSTPPATPPPVQTSEPAPPRATARPPAPPTAPRPAPPQTAPPRATPPPTTVPPPEPPPAEAEPGQDGPGDGS